MIQHPIEPNILIQNIYPEILINNTKGYLMPLNRKDSRRTIIQRKNTDLVNSQYWHNITRTIIQTMRKIISQCRQAWREKVALVVIILLISSFMGFLAFGLATIACGIRKQTFFKEDVFENFESGHIHGILYKTGQHIIFGNRRPLTPPIEDKKLEPIIFLTFGLDISDYFPLDQ
ncbi:7060_t:CDS:2, partial [Funneliformis mosseae]